MFNLFLGLTAFFPLLVILFTYMVVEKRKLGVALRMLDMFLRKERLTYLYAAFGPHLFISHFTMFLGLNEHTLAFGLGLVLTILAITFIREHLVFTLASTGPLLIMTHFTLEFALNTGTMLMLLGIIFTGAALLLMDKRPEL